MARGKAKDARMTALARVLALLSRVFLEPEAEAQDELRVLARGLPGNLQASVRAMIRSHENGMPLSEEYVRLFLRGTDGPCVHLYESVHRSGRIMDPDVMASLRRLYKEAEIRPRQNLPLPPDHLSLELDCLAHCLMALQEDAGSTCACEHVAHAMLGQHLRPFAQALCARLEETAPHTYYLHAARALSEALRCCQERLPVAGKTEEEQENLGARDASTRPSLNPRRREPYR
jgi:TorA maturation chaperone TorD